MKKRYLKCPDCGKEMTCDRVRTGRAAKRVGGYYERQVARKMQKLTGLRFRKTPRSGGLHIPGDVICIDPDIKLPFNIECKNYEDMTLLRVFKNPRCLLTLDWKDLETDVLIFNDRGTHIVIINAKQVIRDTHLFGLIELNGDPFYILTIEEFCKKLIEPLKEKDEV